MVHFKFVIKCPIFVARQWMRHRTASINEISARYSILPDNFYLPDKLYGQDNVNKQSSDENVLTCSDKLIAKMKRSYEGAYELYTELLESGVSRETARQVLPTSIFTEFVWCVNLHNLFHFLKLRLDWHAQSEIRLLANKVFDIVKEKTPLASRAFQDYVLHRSPISSNEYARLTGESDTPFASPTEESEYQQKLANLRKKL